MDKEKRMRGIVTAYSNSEKGAKQFAISKKVTLGQLKYWVKKLNKEKHSSSSFVQVNPSPTRVVNDLIEINYPNGVKIKVPTGDLSFLSQLIRVY
jgi:hypothetical protein